MKPSEPSERFAALVPGALAELLGLDRKNLDVQYDKSGGADLIINAHHTFVIEVKKSTSAAQIASAAKHVLDYAQSLRRRCVPVVAVPYMGEIGRSVCEQAGVNWLDLSGNAHIIAPGLRIVIEGRPNRFRTSGRPTNLFAPKSSRITRWLLINGNAPVSQREIAHATGLGEGFVSKLVARMISEEYLVRRPNGLVQAKDPSLLLEAWRDAYQFSKHALLAGHVASRGGDELLVAVTTTLDKAKVEFAATGLAAAWLLTHFAAFRIATLYLPIDPPAEVLEKMGFREDARGSNLWLVIPNDAGVFESAKEVDGVRCVHPVQAYVDLKAHPERAKEAAERLREERLNWGING